jgi:hypothetical protein
MEFTSPASQVSGGYFANITNAALGAGHANTTAITTRELAGNTGAEFSRAHRGGGKTDWSLPSTNELMLLCQWSKGQSQNPTGTCPSATIARGNFLIDAPYLTSNEFDLYKVVTLDFSTGSLVNKSKGISYYTRPIRAFGIFTLSTAPSITSITTRTLMAESHFGIELQGHLHRL